MRVKEYKHFDSPTKPFSGVPDYISPKARNPAVIAERRSWPTGTILAEQQRRGSHIAEHVINKFSKESQAFIIRTIGAVGIGTAAHSLEQGRPQAFEVMRSRLHMPWLIRDRNPRGPNYDELIEYAQNTWHGVAGASRQVVQATVEQRRDLNARRMAFGRIVGRASLVLANINLEDTIHDVTPAQAQTWSREQGLSLLADARSLATELGSIPSLAQLADTDSDLSFYIRRNAPDDVYVAFDAAQAQYAMPR